MNTRRFQRIRRGAAEQLLQGGQAPVPDPLARLLASAAAPRRPGELAREDTAVAAFHAARLAPVAASRRGQMVTPPLARFLTTKIAALVSVPVTRLCLALTADVHAILAARPGTGARGAGRPGSARHSPANTGRPGPAAPGQPGGANAGQRPGGTGPGLDARDRAAAL